MSERVRYRPNNVFVAKVADMENGCFQIPYCQMFEREAYECADKVILEVNPRFRRVRGGLDIPIERVTAFFVSDTPFFTIERSVPTEMEKKIGRYVADMIGDGDCIQLGIGGLPDAVGEYLKEKNDLGIHTEVLSSSMADLIERGNANGKYKNLNPGEHICCFCLGDEHLYDVIASEPASIPGPAAPRITPTAPCIPRAAAASSPLRPRPGAGACRRSRPCSRRAPACPSRATMPTPSLRNTAWRSCADGRYASAWTRSLPSPIRISVRSCAARRGNTASLSDMARRA